FQRAGLAGCDDPLPIDDDARVLDHLPALDINHPARAYSDHVRCALSFYCVVTLARMRPRGAAILQLDQPSQTVTGDPCSTEFLAWNRGSASRALRQSIAEGPGGGLGTGFGADLVEDVGEVASDGLLGDVE